MKPICCWYSYQGEVTSPSHSCSQPEHFRVAWQFIADVFGSWTTFVSTLLELHFGQQIRYSDIDLNPPHPIRAPFAANTGGAALGAGAVGKVGHASILGFGEEGMDHPNTCPGEATAGAYPTREIPPIQA